jgi:hypothetical protein
LSCAIAIPAQRLNRTSVIPDFNTVFTEFILCKMIALKGTRRQCNDFALANRLLFQVFCAECMLFMCAILKKATSGLFSQQLVATTNKR